MWRRGRYSDQGGRGAGSGGDILNDGEDNDIYAPLSTGDGGTTADFPDDNLDVISPVPMMADDVKNRNNSINAGDGEDDDVFDLRNKFDSGLNTKGENEDGEEEEEEEEDNDRLKPGDHIFVWNSVGVPRAYQRHAIVLSVTPRESNEPYTDYDLDDDELGAQPRPPPQYDVTVASFYHNKRPNPAQVGRWSLPGSGRWRANRAASRAAAALAAAEHEEEERIAGESLLRADGEINDSDDINTSTTAATTPPALNHNIGVLGGVVNNDGESTTVKVKKEDLEIFAQNQKVHKVTYGSSRLRRLLGRSGTVTLIKADDNEVVLARARYIMSNPDILPEYNAMAANAEAASVWCRTGRFCTLQGASILEITAIGQAGSAAVAGGIVSQLWVLVPAPGIWGAYGWFWYVPATVAYPFLVPILVGFGLASLVPLQVLRRYRQRWKTISDGMNTGFWLQVEDDFKTKHFGSTASSDDSHMRSFFGMRNEQEQEDENRGMYMPVGGPGDDDDELDESEEHIMQRHNQNMAINYDADGGEFGRRPDQQQAGPLRPLRRQMSSLVQRFARPQNGGNGGGGIGLGRFGGNSSRTNITLESTQENDIDHEPIVTRDFD